MAERKQIVLRVVGSVKSGIAKKAKAEGISINEYSQKVLARAAGVKLDTK